MANQVEPYPSEYNVVAESVPPNTTVFAIALSADACAKTTRYEVKETGKCTVLPERGTTPVAPHCTVGNNCYWYESASNVFSDSLQS